MILLVVSCCCRVGAADDWAVSSVLPSSSILFPWISSKCSMTRRAIRLNISSIKVSTLLGDDNVGAVVDIVLDVAFAVDANVVVAIGCSAGVLPSFSFWSSLFPCRKSHSVVVVVLDPDGNFIILTLRLVRASLSSSCKTNFARDQAALLNCLGDNWLGMETSEDSMVSVDVNSVA